MDLKNTINNTNTQKENIKTVATQIDNKLVELGGEQATDLSDVANKMGAMVTRNYAKLAKISSGVSKNDFIDQDGLSPKNIKLTTSLNIDFEPDLCLIEIDFKAVGTNAKMTVTYLKNENIQNKYSVSVNSGTKGLYCNIKNVTLTKEKVTVECTIGFTTSAGWQEWFTCTIEKITLMQLPIKEVIKWQDTNI